MKQILFFFFFTIHLVSAQIKPINFALQSRFNALDFPENKRIILNKLHNILFEATSKQMDSLAKTKSKCMNYVGIDTRKADILCLIDFYKGDLGDFTNLPVVKYLWIDNLTKDTLKGTVNWRAALKKYPKSVSEEYELQEEDFAFLVEEFLYSTNFVFNGNTSSCENIVDYKLQKQHKKEVVFMAYPTVSSNQKGKKLSQLIDNIINNQLVTKQITVEQYKHIDRRFIFYPYNKETKNIKPDITIQFKLVQNTEGNYELKGDFKGKDINFKAPSGGEEMKKTLIFNKKRIDNEDYTELIYKLNLFVCDIYVYNMLF